MRTVRFFAFRASPAQARHPRRGGTATTVLRPLQIGRGEMGSGLGRPNAECVRFASLRSGPRQRKPAIRGEGEQLLRSSDHFRSDEVKWGLDWVVRMQNAYVSLLCVQGLASASPPSEARGNSYYGPPTTSDRTR